jgi:hypothetical protein
MILTAGSDYFLKQLCNYRKDMPKLKSDEKEGFRYSSFVGGEGDRLSIMSKQ